MRRRITSLLSISLLLAAAAAVALTTTIAAANKVFVQDSFDTHYKSRWTVSDWKKAEETNGNWMWSDGKFPVGDGDKGLQTTEDLRFYAISRPLTTPFSKSADANELVIQFSVKHEQRLMPACGGGYLKLLPTTTKQSDFSGDSPFIVNFGPDICGTQTRHVILGLRATDSNGDHYIYTLKEPIRCETDQSTHFYTLRLFGLAGGMRFEEFEIYIDGHKRDSGSLDFATNHDRWELRGGGGGGNGGKRPKGQLRVDVSDAKYVGWELWQVRAGSLFDNILVTDNLAAAQDDRVQRFSAEKRERETALIDKFLEQEEKEHQETTRRIEEMRQKQDAQVEAMEADESGTASTTTKMASNNAGDTGSSSSKNNNNNNEGEKDPMITMVI